MNISGFINFTPDLSISAYLGTINDVAMALQGFHPKVLEGPEVVIPVQRPIKIRTSRKHVGRPPEDPLSMDGMNHILDCVVHIYTPTNHQNADIAFKIGHAIK